MIEVLRVTDLQAELGRLPGVVKDTLKTDWVAGELGPRGRVLLNEQTWVQVTSARPYVIQVTLWGVERPEEIAMIYTGDVSFTRLRKVLQESLRMWRVIAP